MSVSWLIQVIQTVDPSRATRSREPDSAAHALERPLRLHLPRQRERRRPRTFLWNAADEIRRATRNNDSYGPQHLLLPIEERRIDSANGVTLVTTYQYDDAGRLLSVNGPAPGSDDTVHYRYDIYGRRTHEIGALGANGVRLGQEHVYRNSDDKVTRINTITVADPDSVTPTVLSRLDFLYDGRRNPVRERVWSGTRNYSILHRTFDFRNCCARFV